MNGDCHLCKWIFTSGRSVSLLAYRKACRLFISWKPLLDLPLSSIVLSDRISTSVYLVVFGA